MTFDEWWCEFSAGEKHLEMADKHVAKAAWDHQQQRIAELEAENKALREAVIKAGLHRQSPCVLCGYNGPEYYQPETHKCAALNGEDGDE